MALQDGDSNFVSLVHVYKLVKIILLEYLEGKQRIDLLIWFGIFVLFDLLSELLQLGRLVITWSSVFNPALLVVFKLSPDPSFFAEAFLIRVRLVVIRGASVGFVIVIVLECLKPFYTDRTSQESVRFGLDSTSEELVVYCVVFITATLVSEQTKTFEWW